MFGKRTPFSRRHSEFPASAGNAQHALGRAVVELTMKAAQKLWRRWLKELVLRGQAIDFGLKAHMRRSFDLKMAPPLVLVEIPSQRAFDILGACVMAFDQIAVVSVCDAYEVRKIRR